MKSSKPSCQKCRFWVAEPGEDSGECRRYAPRAILPISLGIQVDFVERDVEIPHEAARRRPQWPETYLTEWCGEWVA